MGVKLLNLYCYMEIVIVVVYYTYDQKKIVVIKVVRLQATVANFMSLKTENNHDQNNR